MAYDVFVVSALEDRDMANLVVRRLRSLKFKCWFDKKQTDTTFDQKDARNALNSQTMLVLWSKDAVNSDWVRAAASVGNSRPGMLLEIGLDETIPYEPFSINKRHSLDGMTTRTTVEGFYEVVEELGRRDGRTDLREWLEFGKDDDDKKAAWLEQHPSDALAIAEAKKRERELAAANENKAGTDDKPVVAEIKDDVEPEKEIAAVATCTHEEAPETKPVAAASTASASAATEAPSNAPASGDSNSEVIGSGYAAGVGKVPGTPGAPYKPGRKGPAGVYTAPAVSVSSAAPMIAASRAEPSEGIGRWMIAGILIGIGTLFLLGGLLRTSPTPKPASLNATASATSGSFALAGETIRIADSCPAGYISSKSLAVLPDTNAKEDEEE